MNNLNNEIWKVIEDFSDYLVSNFGRIKSFKRDKLSGKILKQSKNKKHFIINLCNNKIKKTKQVHILVFETFSNYKLKSDECVHHIDKDKENNNFNNLILMTKSSHNSLHNKGESHRDCKGEKNPNFGNKHSYKIKEKISKLNRKILSQKIIDIQIDIEKGDLNQAKIAKKYNMSTATISRIKNKKIFYLKNGEL